LQSRHDRFQQPFHAQGVIVKPPQINIGGDFAVGQGPVEMLRAGFADGQVADAIKILFFDGRLPTPTSFVLFLGDDVLQYILPGSHCQFGISAVEIHPRQREIEIWLKLRFVVCLENPLRFQLIARLEAFLFAGDFVFEVENASGTSDQTECLFHCFTNGYECVRFGIPRVSEQWKGYSRAVTGF
jgi:hypothetical protein